jgi:hypothetical protein
MATTKQRQAARRGRADAQGAEAEARKLDIKGRSKMGKAEVKRAVQWAR